jgi:flagellar assembly protein FliH
MTNSSSSPAFAFPQLPPDPFPPAADRRPPTQTQSPDSIVNAALAEAEQIRELARAEGYETGRRAASVEAEERFESAFAAVGEALAQAREMRVRTADDVERQAVELALQIAEKAIAGALDAQPERVLDVIRGALRCLLERERVTILVNPDDLETARAAVGDLALALGGIEHCDVQEERRVERGGAIVRSATGEIDATLGTKLERARETLESELSR